MENKEILKSFLNNINIFSTYEKNYKTFLELVSYLETLEDIDINNIEIIENSKLNELLQNIVNNNMDKIKNNKISEICKSEIGINLIDTYCILNNIYDNTQVSNNIDILNSYLKLINKYPTLSREQEIELFEKYHNGDEKAKEKLINSNLKLVFNVAKRYCNKGVSIMDLIQEGNLVLIRAVEKFDLSKNTKFSTFAYVSLARGMDQSIVDNGRNIKIPTYMYNKLKKYYAQKKELEQKYNRTLTTKELSNELNCTLEEVETLEKLKFDTVSFNEIIIDNSKNRTVELGSTIPDDVDLYENYEKKSLQENLYKLLLNVGLNKTELYVIKRILEGEKLLDIAQELELTHQRISQIEHKIFKKIIMSEGIEKLAVYMDDEDKALNNIKEKRKKFKKKH